MRHFLPRRLLLLFPTIIGVSLLAFILVRLVPGSPWERGGQRALRNTSVDPATRRSLDRTYGLDLPAWRQYLRYMVGDFDQQAGFLCGLPCGNLGPSLRQRGRSISEIIFTPPEGRPWWENRLGYSARLALFAMLLALALGLPAGMTAAVRRNSFFDRTLSLLASTLLSVPSYILGLLLLVTLATGLGWISIRADWQQPSAWITPALVLAASPAAALMRLARGSVLDVLRQDYVRTARSVGLSERWILWVHVFRNAALPVLTMIGPLLGELVAGSFVIEAMFGFPGIGREFWEAVAYLDYSMVMAVILVYAVFISLSNLAVDLFYGLLDPRLRQPAEKPS